LDTEGSRSARPLRGINPPFALLGSGPPKPELGDGGQVGNASEDTFNFTYSMVSIKRA